MKTGSNRREKMSTTRKKVIIDANINKHSLNQFTVHRCVYHRNGISGIGFYALHIEWPEDGYTHLREAVVTVDGHDVDNFRDKKPHDPATRVLMLDNVGGVDIDDTMRGDWFHEALINWIIEDHHKRDKL
jgi:hypothetical protein